MAVERGEAMVDELPSSSTHPSKKQKKEEEENVRSLGGMRNPAITVSRMQSEWIRFVTECPDAVDVASNYGMEEAKFNMELMGAWRSRLMKLFKVEELRGDGLILGQSALQVTIAGGHVGRLGKDGERSRHRVAGVYAEGCTFGYGVGNWKYPHPTESSRQWIAARSRKKPSPCRSLNPPKVC